MSKTNPTYAALIYSFSDDALATVECIRAIRRQIPDIPVCIVEDSNKPFADAERASIEARDVEIWQTAANRPGNLKGIDCVRAMIETAQAWAVETGADYVWKIDPDTLILDQSVFTDLAQGDVLALWPSNRNYPNFAESPAAEQHPDGWGQGFTYLLHQDALAPLAEHFASATDAPGEDVALSLACMALFPPAKLAWLDFGKPRFTGFSFIQRGHVVPPHRCRYYHDEGWAVAYFGNRHELPNAYSHREKREWAAMFARHLNDYIDAQANV